jgi:hypothetical protein
MVFNLSNKYLRSTNQTNKSEEHILVPNEIIHNRIIITVSNDPCDKYINDFYKCMNTNNNCNNNCNNHFINFIKCKIEELNAKI